MAAKRIQLPIGINAFGEEQVLTPVEVTVRGGGSIYIHRRVPYYMEVETVDLYPNEAAALKDAICPPATSLDVDHLLTLADAYARSAVDALLEHLFGSGYRPRQTESAKGKARMALERALRAAAKGGGGLT